MKRSATQYNAGAECPRKYWFPYVGGVEREQTRAQEHGSEIHEDLELYVSGEKMLEELEDPASFRAANTGTVQRYRRLAEQGEAQVEWKWVSPDGKKGGIIDVALIGERVICDYKTTKDLKWAKTADELAQDIQVNVYAEHGFEVIWPDADRIRFEYLYIQRDAAKEPRLVTFVLTREENEKFMRERVAPLHSQLDQYDEMEVQHVPRNERACNNFGGCPYRQICRNADKRSRYEGVGKIQTERRTRMDASKFLKKKKTAPEPPPEPPNTFGMTEPHLGRLKAAGVITETSVDLLGFVKYCYNQNLDDLHDTVVPELNETQLELYGSWREAQESEDVPSSLEDIKAQEAAGTQATVEQLAGLSHQDKMSLIAWRQEQGSPQPVNSPQAAPNHEPGKPVNDDGTVKDDFENAGVPAGTRLILIKEGLTSWAQVATKTEGEIGQIKGIGPAKVEKLKEQLEAAGYSFATPAEDPAGEGPTSAPNAPNERERTYFDEHKKAVRAAGGKSVLAKMLFIGCAPSMVEQGNAMTLEMVLQEMVEDVAEAAGVPHFTLIEFGEGNKALLRTFESAYKAGDIPHGLVVRDPYGALAKVVLPFLYAQRDLVFVHPIR